MHKNDIGKTFNTTIAIQNYTISQNGTFQNEPFANLLLYRIMGVTYEHDWYAKRKKFCMMYNGSWHCLEVRMSKK